MRVNKDLLVQLHYKMYMVEEDGSDTLIEKTDGELPLGFIHGMRMLLPAFETEIVGLSAGDTFDLILEPNDAYGEVLDELIMDLPKEMFEVDGKFAEEKVYEGAEVELLTDEGDTVTGLVITVGEEVVVVDLNHPLAGLTLRFEGEIELVKEPTAAEYNALFAVEEHNHDHHH